jgi:hypothetical protein
MWLWQTRAARQRCSKLGIKIVAGVTEEFHGSRTANLSRCQSFQSARVNRTIAKQRAADPRPWFGAVPGQHPSPRLDNCVSGVRHGGMLNSKVC